MFTSNDPGGWGAAMLVPVCLALAASGLALYATTNIANTRRPALLSMTAKAAIATALALYAAAAAYGLVSG
jgi:hypothetical protein